MNRQKLIKFLTRAGLLLFFAAAAAFTSIKYSADIVYMAANPEVFKNTLASYGATGIIVFIGIQASGIFIDKSICTKGVH